MIVDNGKTRRNNRSELLSMISAENLMNIPVKVLSLSVIAALTLMVCGKEPPPPPAPVAAPPPPLTVKIGHVGPLTGQIAHLGKDNENGARLAIDEANAKGTEIGARRLPSSCLPKMPERPEGRNHGRAETDRTQKSWASSAISIPACRFPPRPCMTRPASRWFPVPPPIRS